MDVYGAYLVGYLTAYSGIPFRTFEILGAVARQSAPDELATIRAHLDFVKSKNDQTADMVVGVDALLAEHGLLQPPKPQTFTQWDAWARNARTAVATATTRGSEVETALLLGEAVASFASALALEDLLRTVVRNTDASESRRAIDDAVREVSETRSRLAPFAEHRGLSPSRGRLVSEVIATTRPLGDPIGDPAARQTIVRSALDYVNRRIRDIDAAFKQ